MPITNKTYPFKLIAIISFGFLGFSHGSFLSDDEFMSNTKSEKNILFYLISIF
jgi:hypothetical protein